MPQGTVTVTSPKGRVVYLNGNYTPDFPKTIPETFLVEYGDNIFETQTAAGNVDYRGTVEVSDDNQDCSIKLKKVAQSGT